MNIYTIYCTEEQTKKALELGAPIENHPMFRYGDNNIPKYVHRNDFNKDCFSYTPTAEQMINWLEEQKIYFSITCIGDYVYEVWIKDNNNNGKVIVNSCVPSRKEATLAAIDAAFEYLSNNNLTKTTNS